MKEIKEYVMDEILSQVGDFGPYQLKHNLLHVMSAFVAGVHMLALSFAAATPDHRCFIPEEFQNDDQFNISHYIPNGEDGKLSSCLKFSEGSNSSTESCGGVYFFNTTYYHSSRVIDWNLVCDRSWLKALLQSIYMFGVLVGAVACGALGDCVGRKPIFCLSAALQFIFGMACAFAPNYELYAIAQFFYGAFGSGGNYLLGFILSMEVVGPSKRTICGTSFGAAFSLGLMVVPFWAWLIPHGKIIQIICAAHGLLFCGHWWLIDESIPWLWSKGRTTEAADIATKAAHVNGKCVKSDLMQLSVTTFGVTIGAITEDVKEKGIISLFVYPNLRCRLLIMIYAWFANCLTYYGLSFNMGTLPGNPFLMGILSGLAEMPGYVIVILWLDRMGRRSMLSSLSFFGGLACILVAFIPQPAVVITLAMLAKVAIAGSFSIVYTYGAELFPTSVRSSALGITTMAARTAGLMSPAVILMAEITRYRHLPILVFGAVALLSSFLTLFLPETTGKEMPQGIEDGEEFGRGDTAFHAICTKGKSTVIDDESDCESSLLSSRL